MSGSGGKMRFMSFVWLSSRPVAAMSVEILGLVIGC